MRSKRHRPYGFGRRTAAPALLLLHDAIPGIASSSRLGAAGRRSKRGQIQVLDGLLMESGPTPVGYKRLHPRARAPERATAGSSGFDLAACLDQPLVLEPGRIALVPTGLALAVPRGMEGQVRARSGLALRHGIAVLNGPGTIDSDYRGPLGVILANLGSATFRIEHGDRIAQIVFAHVPLVELREETELGETDRGEGGFGHTGT